MDKFDFVISISGWIFGLISCICAVIQTISKNKYKKQLITKQKVKAGKHAQVTQIGGISFGKTDS